MALEHSASWEPGEPIIPAEDPLQMVTEMGGGAPLIKVVGVGGGGSNAVSRMFKEKLPVVEYYSVTRA